MKKIVFIFIAYFLTHLGFAQSGSCTFSGTILNTKGEPIPYSSIYFPKLTTGKMSNMDGNFKINLPCGKYKIKIQSLGYQTQILEIDASSSQKKKIVLNSKSFQIKEVVIDGSAEDPAYNVMRKAIVMAKYYKKQLKAYECNIYVRDYFVVNNLPGLAKLFADKEEVAKMKAGEISETLLNYSYEFPNKISEKIISTRNARGDTSKTMSSYINLSFYNIGGTEIISPLSKSAFSVYKFELINTYIEEGITVNKIKIIPKRKGNDLMKGYLYINDNSWNINSVDVKFKAQMIDVTYKQHYSEVSENAWMPINHEILVKAKLMGFKGHYKYIASLSKIKIETDKKIDKKIETLIGQPISNENIKDSSTPKATTPAPVKKQSKTVQKISALMEKDKLTRGETLKLVRLVNKESKQERDEPQSLEVTTNHKTEYADSAFARNDSLWQEIRAVPLSTEEAGIYKARDSLIQVKNGDTLAENRDTLMRKNRSFWNDLLFFNRTIKSKNKQSKLKVPGLLSGVGLNFNTVDGFLLSKKLFSYRRDFNKGKFIYFKPTLLYAFARKDIMGKFHFKSQYNMKKRASFFFSLGKINADFNNDAPMSNIFNSFSTLFFTDNYKKLYQKKFFNIGHAFDIKNGLSLTASLKYEDRKRLYNNSAYRFIKRKEKVYTPNTPLINKNDTSISVFKSHVSTTFNAMLSYTPKQFYRYTKNKKQLLPSAYPTFDLNYRQGLNNTFDGQTDFSFLEISMHQSTKINLIDKVSYHIGGGKFLRKNALYFADYKSFNSQPFYIIDHSDINSFRLLGFYENNVNDYFAEAHLSIEDNVLLLKRLPVLNNTNLTEGFYANYLYTGLNEHYYEFGYGLKNLFLLFDIEAFASFKNQQHNAIGLKLRLNFVGNNRTN